MHKIACVFSFRESEWVSCQKIVFNLHKAYEGIPGVKIHNFDFNQEISGANIVRTSEEIFALQPDTIVIMDHRPHPIYLLKTLLQEYSGRNKPRFVFHVFGDFTLHYRDWDELSKLLKGYEVEFIVASDRQKLLIDRLLLEPHTSTVCPFPVKEEEYSFLPQERKKQRESWGVNDDDIVFTFTGRISRQKRTHLLLKAFDEALRRENSASAHLFIYGMADHLGDIFLGLWENENEYFRKIHRQYMALPESSRSRIHFMGSVPGSELRAVYAGADYFLNLSVHNDEDFGMSVAEAQMTGLPCILTDWGGLASFEHPQLPEATRFIKVRIGIKSKVISFEETVETICHAMKSSRQLNREKLISLAHEKFSVRAASQIMSRILGEKFQVFQSFSLLHKLIIRRLLLEKPIYITKELKIHPIYRRLYSAYVRNP